MSKYGCIRTDNMSGTVNGKDLVSLEYQASNVAADIENGCVVKVGGYKAGNREIRIATAMAATTPLSDLAVIASEEIIKEKNHNTLSEFINKAGSPQRGYRLTSKDIYSATKEAFTIDAGFTVAVGSVVEAVIGTKPSIVETLTSGSTKIGDVIAIEGDFIVVEIA